MGIFSNKSLRVAILQMNIIQGQKEVNIIKALNMIDTAIERGAKIICLPEAFATGINFMCLNEMAERIPGGNVFQVLAEKAKTSGVYIVAGILEKEESNIYDSAVIFNSDGSLIGKYRRRFLWSGEKNFITPRSEKANCFETEFGKIGLILGYEIFFPETCRQYFIEDADIIICLADIFESLSSSAEQLCRSRALENQCYFIFASCLGLHPLVNMDYMGMSSITCDPDLLNKFHRKSGTGEMDIIYKSKSKEEVIVQELFIEDVRTKRKTAYLRNDFLSEINDTKLQK